MPDLPEIPANIPDIPEGIPETPEISGDEILENSVEKDSDLEGKLSETDNEVDKEVGKDAEAGNDYLDSLLKQAEELGVDPETLEKALVVKGDVNNINEQILNEGKNTKKEMHEEAYPGEKEENPEIIDGEWRWVEEPLNETTRESLNESEWLADDFTQEERENLHAFERFIFNDPRTGGMLRSLESLSTDEQDRQKELIKLLIRIAIKMAAKTSSAIAKNIAKSSDDETTKAVFGTIGDLTDSASGFLESAITGREKPNLGQDVYRYVTNESG
jgi:hypothetical protein